MNGYRLLALLPTLALQGAFAQAPDTSEWECQLCPFVTGANTDYRVGASVQDDDAARFGDATGYDDEGGYLNVDGAGTHISDNYRWGWQVEDLGLTSRVIELNGGKPGSYGYRIGYRQLPHFIYDSTRTIFSPTSDGGLATPDGWDPSGWASNADFATDVNNNLVPRDIESERRELSVGGDYIFNSRLDLFADYSREERDGVDIIGGANFTNAAQLPRPFDYQTDQLEFGLRYRNDRGTLKLAYYGSFFDNSYTGLLWDNPFRALPGADQGQLAQPPDNNAHQITLSGVYRLNTLDTVVSFSAGMGRMSNEDTLLPYTVNPTLAGNPLPANRLDGDVDTTLFALRVTSRPLDKTRVRFAYRFNNRDNGAAVNAWNRVIVDALVSGAPETNNPYSFKRTSISLAGDYDLLDTVQLSASIERKELDRDLQEVAEQTEDIGWGRVRWRPNGWFDVSAKAGTARRDIDRYDETLAASFGQNPLLRKYNLAFRYREFAEIAANAALPNTDVTIGANVLYADDSYTRSLLGLLSSDDTRYGVDIAWQASDKTSIYAHSSWQDINADQAGSEFFAQPDWRANTSDSFQAYGIGLSSRALSDKVDLSLDYTHSDGSSEITVLSAGGGDSRFPNIESDLDSLRLSANYRWSDRLSAVFEVRYENFEIADWALQGVTPTAVPNLLALGARPFDYDVLVFGLSFRYGFGGGDLTLRSEAQ